MRDYVRKAADLRPVLEQNQAAGDSDRRLTDEAMAAMRDAGMFRMFVPPSLGGLDLDLLTSVDALAELAKGDPSASWVAMILGAADLVVGQLSERAQREIYADGPDTRVCVVLTPHLTAQRVDGGWRLTGECFPASRSCGSRTPGTPRGCAPPAATWWRATTCSCRTTAS